MSERADLEATLAQDPFDGGARSRYARLLEAEGDGDAALGQWRLLLRDPAHEAAARLEAARLATSLGQLDVARELLLAAVGDAPAPAPAAATAAPPPVDDEEGDDEPVPAAIPLRALPGGGERIERPGSVTRIEEHRVKLVDVVGMEDLKKVVRLRIIEPFVRPGLFQRFRRRAGGGVLLYGPPGCGKTLMARAIAGECDASFHAIGISDVLSRWMGVSEQNLELIFEKARSEAPAVLFFDELDALAYSRSKATNEHTRAMVNQFLAMLDGMESENDGLLVLAATNMPWDVDPAMKRPGRFDRQVFVPPPDADARAEMFRRKLRDVPTDGLDHVGLAANAHHFSGADVDGVIDRAKDAVLMGILDGGDERPLRQPDLLQAVEDAEPSTLDWLRTARNIVKFGGMDKSYKDVEKYLRANKLL